jgi:hypothetical protein
VAGKQVSLDDVGDKGEIPALLAVAEDHGPLPASIVVMNRESTPEYCEEGSWRGPKTLKYRKETVSNP